MPNTPPIQTALTGDTSGLDAALQQAQAKVAGTGKAMEKNMEGAAAGTNRLRGAMTSLAIDATNVNPALGRVASTIASFQLSGPVMIGILAGLAAMATAWRLIGAEAREAAKEQQSAVDRL